MILNTNSTIATIEDENRVYVKKGQAKAILPEEADTDYYQWSEGERDFDLALEKRIRTPIENGMLIVRDGEGNVKFDDRKLRFDSFERLPSDPSDPSKKYLNVFVAPTHFGELKATGMRALNDPEFEATMLRKGHEDYKDPHAYSAVPIGVNALPITREGHIHLFQRQDKGAFYPGEWHVAGGFLDTDYTFMEAEDPSKGFRDLIRKNITDELLEELGVTPEEAHLTLRGIARNGPAIVDFYHTAVLDMPAETLKEQMKDAIDRGEHQNHVILTSPEEARAFISTHKVVPSGYSNIDSHLRAQAA